MGGRFFRFNLWLRALDFSHGDSGNLLRNAMSAQLFSSQSGQPKVTATKDPMRGSVRFPLHLPVKLHCGEETIPVTTEDISSTGVQFRGPCAAAVAGTEVRWMLCLPASVMGTPHDVTVKCAGRVMWQRRQDDECRYGVVIDSYKLKDKEA